MALFYIRNTLGEILRHGGCPADTVALQAGEGETAVTVDAPYEFDNYYVDSGDLVLKPPQPAPHHVFDYTTKQWIDPRTLADLKAAKTAEINAARLTANRGTFTFMGKPISCDELSRSDIDGVNGIVTLLGTMPPDWIGFWKTADNDYLAIPDEATWTGLYGAMVAQGQANFAHSQALKAALAAAESPEAVAAINW